MPFLSSEVNKYIISGFGIWFSSRKEKYDTSKDKYIVDSKSEKDYTISLLANGDLKLKVNNKSNKDKVIAKNVLLYEIAAIIHATIRHKNNLIVFLRFSLS